MPNTAIQVENKNIYTKKYYSSKRYEAFKLNDKVWVRDLRSNVPKWCEGVVVNILGSRTCKIRTGEGMIWKRHLESDKSKFLHN